MVIIALILIIFQVEAVTVVAQTIIISTLTK